VVIMRVHKYEIRI